MMLNQGSGSTRRQRSPVAVISKDCFLDTSLSIAAKGLMGVFCTLEDDQGDVDEAMLAEAAGLPLHDVSVLLAELEEREHLATGEAAERIAREQESRQYAELAQHQRPQGRLLRSSSVVYYLRRIDGAVKIGFSENLGRRINTLQREHGPLDVLATEPGGWHEEQERHRQFERSRIRPDREWFTASAVLERHIKNLQTLDGRPGTQDR